MYVMGRTYSTHEDEKCTQNCNLKTSMEKITCETQEFTEG
jgi:hypothetical protein